MKQYKIWNNIQNTEYKGSNSFGTNDHVEMDMLVGTSSKNSFLFAEINQNIYFDEQLNRFQYQLTIDNKIVKEGFYYPKTKTMTIFKVDEHGNKTEVFTNAKHIEANKAAVKNWNKKINQIGA